MSESHFFSTPFRSTDKCDTGPSVADKRSSNIEVIKQGIKEAKRSKRILVKETMSVVETMTRHDLRNI